MSKVDEIDRAIIRLLNENGRMSSAEMARRMGDIPARTGSHRADNLLQRGIIFDQLSKIPGVGRARTHLLPKKVKDSDNWLPLEVADFESSSDL